MKNLFRKSWYTFLFCFLAFSCSEEELAEPSATLSKDANTGSIGTNGYDISPIEQVGDGGTTWRFTLTRTGKAKDISHLVIGVDVFCPGSPQTFTIGAWTINGVEQGANVTQYTEGNGTGCNLSGFQNFFKFEFTRTFVQGKETIIEFTTDPPIQVSSWFVAVKAGNSCAISQVPGTPCTEEPPTGTCSLSQGYFFAKPGPTWEGKTVTFGAHSYTQEEGKAIWLTSNRGGKLDVKAAFLQAATIKLNFEIKKQSIPEVLEDAIATIDAYFTNTFTEKLTPTNIPPNSDATKALKAAADTLSMYISANHCKE